MFAVQHLLDSSDILLHSVYKAKDSWIVKTYIPEEKIAVKDHTDGDFRDLCKRFSIRIPTHRTQFINIYVNEDVSYIRTIGMTDTLVSMSVISTEDESFYDMCRVLEGWRIYFPLKLVSHYAIDIKESLKEINEVRTVSKAI